MHICRGTFFNLTQTTINQWEKNIKNSRNKKLSSETTKFCRHFCVYIGQNCSQEEADYEKYVFRAFNYKSILGQCHDVAAVIRAEGDPTWYSTRSPFSWSEYGVE